MTQTEINDALMNALRSLYETNQMLHDYWMSELWDENDNPIGENWNENNVRLMENDVMQQLQVSN